MKRLLLAATLSGAAALIHETLWTRAMSTVLGSTVEASAVTFAAFLVGLAFGSRVGGTLPGRMRIRTAYVAIEIGIAVTGVGAGLLVHALRDVLPALIGSPSAASRALLDLGTSLALVIVPTMLMGATLPVLLALSHERGGARTRVPRIYAANTIGGALGTLLCGFVTLRFFGMRATLGVAALFNLTSSALVLFLPDASASHAREEEPTFERVPSERVLLVFATLGGAAILAFEVVWSRLASWVLGTRIFATTILLAWVLVLLGASAAYAPRLVQRRRHDMGQLLLRVSMAAPAALFVSFALVRIWIAHQLVLDETLARWGVAGVLARIAIVGAMMSPALLALGLLFPLTLTASRDASERVGRAAGTFYLWNTLGSVVGALATGFFAMPMIGVYATGSVLAGAAALLVIGVAIGTRARGPLVFASACLLVIALFTPPPLQRARPGLETLMRREDRYGVFQVTRSRGRVRAMINNTELVYPLGIPITAYVQQMQGHLGVLANPKARTALVLGNGYGITAGVLGTYPSIERVDAVELLPAMLEAAPLFEPYNLSSEKNPRVHRLCDDGRHFLAGSRDAYDIISINVADPHLPGSASLFTRDFYRLVARHLRDSGVVIVHAFGNPDEVQIILATVTSVFGSVRLYRAYDNGFNVVASMQPVTVDADAIREVTATPAVQDALHSIGFPLPIDAVQIFEATSRVAWDQTLIATDDLPRLEFSTAGSPAQLLHIE